jgi:Gpi18-like mannosyltransferase
VLVAGWAAAVVARAALLFLAGHPVDLAAFHAWALRLAEGGPWRFYAPGVFSDYLPGYLLALWPVGLLLRDNPELAPVLLKVPPAVADLAVGWLLARLGGKQGGAAALAYLLNPAGLVAGAWWGQAESAAVAWLLGSAAAWQAGRPGWAGVLFGMGCLTKPQYALAGAVLLVGLVAGAPGRRWLASAVAAAALTAAAGAALFGLSPAGLARLALAASGVYPYGSVNALNLWYLVGLNWRPDSLPVLGLPAAAWGVVLAGVPVAWASWRVAGYGELGRAAVAAAVVSVIVFVAATRMHERYLFPAVPLSLLAWAHGRATVWLVVALSASLVANLLYGLAYLGTVPQYATPLWAALWRYLGPPTAHGVAAFTVAVAGWTLKSAWVQLPPRASLEA